MPRGKKPVPLGVKCRKCGADEWSLRPGGRACAACVKRRSKKWYEANTEKQKKRTKAQRLLRQYGLTVEAFTMMRLRQRYRCAICGRKPIVLCVDHDHKTGRVRALLCSSCNRGLGKFRDNPDVLRKAADYVETHKQAP